MNRIKILTGKKVVLVVPEKSDAELWYRWINNLETQSLLAQNGNILFLEDEQEYYESLRKDKTQKTFSIMTLSEEKIIGNISLFAISDKHRSAMLGVMLGDTTEQNKGYGTEAIKLILAYAFETLGLNKVKLEVFASNQRAYKVYKNCGFSTIGTLKEEKYINGKHEDSVMMEIMRSEYKNTATK